MADVPENHARAYMNNVNQLAQQQGSKLLGTVRQDGDIRGEMAYFDSIGFVGMTKRSSPTADTQLSTTPRQRRAAVIADYERAELVSREDQLKTIYEMSSPLVQTAVNAAGVTTDTIILAALGADAVSGQIGDGTSPFPPGNKVAVNASGLTLAKITSAVKILKSSGAFSMGARHAVIDAELEEDVLTGITEAKSSDFTRNKVMDSGTVDGITWLGFTWHVLGTSADGNVAVLPKDGSGNSLAYFYVTPAIGFARPDSIYTSIDNRPDKSNAKQILVKLNAGCVRIDDAGIAEVACQV